MGGTINDLSFGRHRYICLQKRTSTVSALSFPRARAELIFHKYFPSKHSCFLSAPTYRVAIRSLEGRSVIIAVNSSQLSSLVEGNMEIAQ